MSFLAFLRDEDGAVTVDWVVLTAGVVILAIFSISTIYAGAIDGVTSAIAARRDEYGIAVGEAGN